MNIHQNARLTPKGRALLVRCILAGETSLRPPRRPETSQNAPPARPRSRAAVIGHTGHGNYGHGLDTVWKSFDFIDVVAVALSRTRRIQLSGDVRPARKWAARPQEK